MKKIFLSLNLTLLAFTLAITPAFAFTLDSIGSSTYTTQTITEWWYTGQNPTLSGTAAASSAISITIDSTAFSTTADASGNWTYTPTTLTTGDHTVSLTGDGQTVSFTIHIGQNVPADLGTTSTSTGSAMPVSGSVSQTLAILGLGAGAIFAGLALKPKTV